MRYTPEVISNIRAFAADHTIPEIAEYIGISTMSTYCRLYEHGISYKHIKPHGRVKKTQDDGTLTPERVIEILNRNRKCTVKRAWWKLAVAVCAYAKIDGKEPDEIWVDVAMNGSGQ